MSETKKEHPVSSFVYGKIAFLNEDTSRSKAMLAKLRRGIGKPPGSLPEIWEITFAGAPEDWQSRGNKPSYAENAVHTALTLYALHKQGQSASMNAHGRSFAAAAAQLIKKDANRLPSIKRRFDAVATAVDFNELAYHARGIIQLLKSADTPIAMDYPGFAADLFYYQMPEQADRVRLRWGEDFYR